MCNKYNQHYIKSTERGGDMTYGFTISINGEKPKRLEEFSPEMQEKIRKASFTASVQALGYKRKTA